MSSHSSRKKSLRPTKSMCMGRPGEGRRLISSSFFSFLISGFSAGPIFPHKREVREGEKTSPSPFHFRHCHLSVFRALCVREGGDICQAGKRKKPLFFFLSSQTQFVTRRGPTFSSSSASGETFFPVLTFPLCSLSSFPPLFFFLFRRREAGEESLEKEKFSSPLLFLFHLPALQRAKRRG